MPKKIICVKGHFEADYEEYIKKGSPPRCPFCKELLSFEGVGEELVPRMAKNEKIFVIAFFGGLLLVFGICHWFLSFKYAMLISAVYAAFGAFIYGKVIRYSRTWF